MAPVRRWRRRGWAEHREAHSYTPEALAARTQAVSRTAAGLKPRRVLDLGSHRGGLLSGALAETGPEAVVAVDADPGCTHALHEAFTDRPVTLVEADLMESASLPARLSRFAPDLTIACGLIHHLALARSEGLARAVDVLSACAGRKPESVLLLEWIPPHDAQLRSLYDNDVFRAPRLGGYTLAALRALLGQQQRSVDEIPLPGTDRILLRCEWRG